MLFFNKKMQGHIAASTSALDFFQFGFKKLVGGYFFECSISEHVLNVASSVQKNQNFDWAGYEYTTNKIHLEDYFDARISDVARAGVLLLQKMQQAFLMKFPEVKSVFVLSCDEEGEFPSVTLTFYILRTGELPIMPFSNEKLDAFDSAVLVSLSHPFA